MYYRQKSTGRIIRDSELRAINELLGDDIVESLITSESIESIDPPDVIDCIRHSSTITAIRRYQEIHGCGAMEADKAIRTIKSDMSRFHVKRKK